MEQKKENINFKDLVKPFKSGGQMIISGIVASLLFALISAYPNNHLNLIYVAIGTFWTFSIWATQWLGHSYLAHQITLKLPFEKYKWKTVIARVLTLVIYSVLAYFVVQYILMTIFNGPQDLASIKNILSIIPYVIGISFFISLLIASIQFYKNWQTTVLEHEKVKAEMMTYKYDSLRNQINPHFLFNSLNVLSDLVIEDQNLALKFIQQLSLLYRYVLDSSQKELVSLQEELKFIKSYQFLLQTRFEEGLNISLPENVDSKHWVVPLSLQLLLENAIKHNVVSEKNPLEISIKFENQHLVISNNYQPKAIGEESSKTGLKNIISRYDFFTDIPVVIDQTSEFFIVKIPLLEKI